MKIIWSLIFVVLTLSSFALADSESVDKFHVWAVAMQLNLKGRLPGETFACHEDVLGDTRIALCQWLLKDAIPNTNEYEKVLRSVAKTVAKMIDFYSGTAPVSFEIVAISKNGEQLCSCFYDRDTQEKSCVPFEKP